MHVSRWLSAVVAAAAIALGLMPGAASAQVRVEPQQLPFYARVVTGTGEWTPVSSTARPAASPRTSIS